MAFGKPFWEDKSRFVDDELPTASLISGLSNLLCCHQRQHYAQLPRDQLTSLFVEKVTSCGIDFARATYSLQLELYTHENIMESAVKLYAWVKPVGNPLYKQFNEATREVLQGTAPVHLYRFGVFYWLMDEFYKRRSTWAYKLLYRGVNCRFNLSLTNRVFKFNHFASFSGNKDVALQFLNEGGTLFIITHGVQNLFIANYSPFPSEDEHLIHPDKVFEITAIVNINDKTEVIITAV